MSDATAIETAADRTPLTTYRRVVVKVGSALLVAPDSGLRRAWLESLCDDIARLRAAGVDVVLVSSGAIALGRSSRTARPPPVWVRSPLPTATRMRSHAMISWLRKYC